MGVLQVLSGLAIAAVLILGASCVSRRSRRVKPAEGAAVIPPAHQPAGGMAVPVITDAPDREERGAFAYDNGVITEATAGDVL